MQNSRDKEGRPIYNPELPSYNPKDKEATSKYEYQNLMNMEIRKRESEKGKEQNIFGRKSQFPLMIGMIERMQKFGESLGQGIVINI